MQRKAESSSHIEQDGFHVSARQGFSCNETPEPERGEIQSGVALTYGCLEELLFFRSERRGGITAMWCSWLD